MTKSILTVIFFLQLSTLTFSGNIPTAAQKAFEHAKKLEFLLEGSEEPLETPAWEYDSETEHLERILAWCREKEYECYAVSLGKSAKNPTNLFVEMVGIPNLHPAYLAESIRAFGGTRWRDIPRLFGYSPRTEPFAERPHPFS